MNVARCVVTTDGEITFNEVVTPEQLVDVKKRVKAQKKAAGGPHKISIKLFCEGKLYLASDPSKLPVTPAKHGGKVYLNDHLAAEGLKVIGDKNPNPYKRVGFSHGAGELEKLDEQGLCCDQDHRYDPRYKNASSDKSNRREQLKVEWSENKRGLFQPKILRAHRRRLEVMMRWSMVPKDEWDATLKEQKKTGKRLLKEVPGFGQNQWPWSFMTLLHSDPLPAEFEGKKGFTYWRRAGSSKNICPIMMANGRKGILKISGAAEIVFVDEHEKKTVIKRGIVFSRESSYQMAKYTWPQIFETSVPIEAPVYELTSPTPDELPRQLSSSSLARKAGQSARRALVA